MRKFNSFQLEEMNHHDKEAKEYALRGEYDYIWEVPTEMFLLKKEYFLPGVKVVDFGCGPSILIKHILPYRVLKNIDYIGVDISKEMLKLAQKNIPQGTFVQADMETKKFKSNSVDIVVSLGALHHSQNQLKTIDNWIKITKKGGKILLREPLYEALHRGEGESPNEEGVKVKLLLSHLKTKNVKVRRIVFFTSPIFHLFNRVLIKIGLSKWQKIKMLWYLIIVIDVSLDRLFGKKNLIFHGLSFAMQIEKI